MQPPNAPERKLAWRATIPLSSLFRIVYEGETPCISLVAGDWQGVALAMALFLFFESPSFANPPQAPKSDREAIAAVLNAQESAWNRGDVEAFLVGYWHSPELTFSGSSGVARGWDGVLARYKKNYPDTATMGKLTFTLIQVKKLSEEYYHVTGKWFLKRSIGDIGGHYTLLFRKINGRWVIISDHSS